MMARPRKVAFAFGPGAEKDPYYYAALGLTGLCGIAAAIAAWALTPWFPW